MTTTAKIYKVYHPTHFLKHPRIFLSNKLVRDCGFKEGDNILVTFEDGKITITQTGAAPAPHNDFDPRCEGCRVSKFCMGHNPDECSIRKLGYH